MVKCNYCHYRDTKLYFRFVDPHASVSASHYIEISVSLRIHLHDYNTHLREGKKEEINEKIKPFIVKVNCDSFFLRKEECK